MTRVVCVCLCGRSVPEIGVSPRDYTAEAVNSNFSDCAAILLSLRDKAVSDAPNSVRANDVAFRADS
jgi:hypothetical protein